MRPGAQRRGWTKLSEAEQYELDSMCERHGFQPAARMLGVSVIVIDRLYQGGAAKEESVERVRHALEQRRMGAA